MNVLEVAQILGSFEKGHEIVKYLVIVAELDFFEKIGDSLN